MNTTYIPADDRKLLASAQSTFPRRNQENLPQIKPKQETNIGRKKDVFELISPEDLSRTFPHLKIVTTLQREERSALYLACYRDGSRGQVFLEIMPQELHQRFAERVNALLKLERPGKSILHELGRMDGIAFVVFKREQWHHLRSIIRWFYSRWAIGCVVLATWSCF